MRNWGPSSRRPARTIWPRDYTLVSFRLWLLVSRAPYRASSGALDPALQHVGRGADGCRHRAGDERRHDMRPDIVFEVQVAQEELLRRGISERPGQRASWVVGGGWTRRLTVQSGQHLIRRSAHIRHGGDVDFVLMRTLRVMFADRPLPNAPMPSSLATRYRPSRAFE